MTGGCSVRARAGWILSIAIALVAFAWLIGTGVSVPAALALTAALVAQTLSGALAWRWVTRRRARPTEWTETLGMGFALGSALSMIGGVALRPWTVWGWALPCLVIAVGWIVARILGRDLGPAVSLSPRALLGAAIAIVLGLGAVMANLARYPLTWTGTWSGYHPDMLFFEALSTSLARYAVSDSIFIPGSRVHYHWFAFAWSGQLTTSLGLEPFVGLTRALPLAVAIAVAALAAGWTARLTRVVWAPGLAATLITAGGFVGAAYGTLLNIDSPSQALSTLWLLAAVYVLLEYLDGALGRGALITLTGLGGVSMGGKLSSAAALIACLAIATGVAWLKHLPWRSRAASGLVAVTGAGVIVYMAFLSGAASSGDLLLFTLQYRASSVQGLDTGGGDLGTILGTVLLAIAVIPRWAGVVGLWADRATRWSPMGTMSLGLVVVGLVPLAILSQGVNELWFALAATVPLAVFSAVGLAEWWQRGGSPRALGASATAGVLLLLVVTLVWAQGESGMVSIRALGPAIAVGAALLGAFAISRVWGMSGGVSLIMVACTILVTAGAFGRLAPVLGRVGSQSTTDPAISGTQSAPLPAGSDQPVTSTEIDYGNSWTMAEVEAARWLAARTGPDDVIVTDRTRPALVPALTGRRTYVSAEQYMVDYASRSTAEAAPVLARIAARFGAAPTEADFVELCAKGVTFGWFTEPDTAPGGRYARTVFANDTVTIVQLDTGACPDAGSAP